MKNDRKTQGEYKIQLTMSINFFSSIGSEEIRTMYNLSDNTEFMIYDETDEIIEESFESLSRKIRKINERKWICCWYCQSIALQTSQNKSK